jgi:transglutaminase-like putative cysteine protease
MKFNVGAELDFSASAIGSLLLNIQALRGPGQQVITELFTTDPFIPYTQITSAPEANRLIQFDILSPGAIKVIYTASAENCFELLDMTNAGPASSSLLDPLVLSYLYPSRYCQSDKLYRLAHNLFGNAGTDFEKVISLTAWIHKNVEYLSGSTDAQTSAFDTVTEQAGVCRDFAHLGIALCRALTIPARYFTGYACGLNPPDFHACFEAYIGERWLLFDATRLAPLNGLLKIASGRDAADTAVANIFGDVYMESIQVTSAFAGENFEPLFFADGDMRAVAYL